MAIMYALVIWDKSLNIPCKVEWVQEINFLDLSSFLKNYHETERSFISWSLCMEKITGFNEKQQLFKYNQAWSKKTFKGIKDVRLLSLSLLLTLLSFLSIIFVAFIFLLLLLSLMLSLP